MFPTLFQLAAKSAAQGIHNDNIPIDFSLDTKSSNAVVRELLELDPKNIEKLKTHKNQLSRLRELDLRKCEIDGEGISNLKIFTLNSLDFGELHHLKAKFPVPIYYGRINIVSFLERALNAHSQEMIIHLGFSGMEEFQIGWEEKISKLLPSLQSIKIIHKVFIEPCGFSNLCISFPNLRTLDISSARCVSTLKGIQNIKSLQKLVMRNVRIEKSIFSRFYTSHLVCSTWLRLLPCYFQGPERDAYEAQFPKLLVDYFVKIPNCDFFSNRNVNKVYCKLRSECQVWSFCSMTSVEDHELKLFVEHHPSLKTVVAISTRCENSHIPTINLLNCLTTHSTMKSLEYAISNDRDRLAENCIVFIGKKLNTIHNQLKDSEISEFLNTLCYVLKESKNDMVKAFAISCFSIASFFGTERFIELFWLETPGMVELIFKSWENFKCSAKRKSVFSLVLTIFERMINFWKMGKILQDRLLQLIMEKTVELSCVYSGYIHRVTSILIEAHRFMSLDLYTTLFMDRKMVKGLFDFAHYLIKLDPQSYQRILELYVRYLYQASKEMLNYLVSNCQAVEKCYEQVMMISQLPTKEAQKNLAEVVLRLM